MTYKLRNFKTDIKVLDLKIACIFPEIKFMKMTHTIVNMLLAVVVSITDRAL